MRGQVLGTAAYVHVHQQSKYVLRMRYPVFFSPLLELLSIRFPRARDGSCTATFNILPRRAKAEQVAFYMRTALCEAHVVTHEMAKRLFEIIDEHGAPTNGGGNAFQPSDLIQS